MPISLTSVVVRVCVCVCSGWVPSLLSNHIDSFCGIACCFSVVSFHLPCLLPPLQQAQAEQEEEFISNTLLKKINLLKKEKETLALNYEQEEEFLTNDLSRKLTKVGGKQNRHSAGEERSTTSLVWREGGIPML